MVAGEKPFIVSKMKIVPRRGALIENKKLRYEPVFRDGTVTRLREGKSESSIFLTRTILSPGFSMKQKLCQRCIQEHHHSEGSRKHSETGWRQALIHIASRWKIPSGYAQIQIPPTYVIQGRPKIRWKTIVRSPTCFALGLSTVIFIRII